VLKNRRTLANLCVISISIELSKAGKFLRQQIEGQRSMGALALEKFNNLANVFTSGPI
jgi:hypothetical protein